jgi:hypothetical protein
MNNHEAGKPGPGRAGMRRASQRLQFCSGVVTGGY